MSASGVKIDPMRQRRGTRANLSGRMAEDQVAARYAMQGAQVLARRWRGQGGEIDLIVAQGSCIIFVEVKCARDHAGAALRLGRGQMDRLCAAASEFCGTLPGGLLSEMRFDLAMVDGQGRIEVVENAFGQD